MIFHCLLPMRALFNGLRCFSLFAPSTREQKREESTFISEMKPYYTSLRYFLIEEVIKAPMEHALLEIYRMIDSSTTIKTEAFGDSNHSPTISYFFCHTVPVYKRDFCLFQSN